MEEDKSISRSIEQLYGNVRKVIDSSKASAWQASNAQMVQAYWNIGRLIMEEEQKGEKRAGYGKQLVEGLSMRLQSKYGRGFTASNLWYMRQFYQMFNILHALRGELSWTHYRQLLKIENQEVRQFYLEEAIAGNWNTRTLERQINSLYYERLLMSSKEGRQEVKKEVISKKEIMQPLDIIKDPYVLEFLDVNPHHSLYEQELEDVLIGKLQEFLLELGRGFSFVGRQYRITAEDSNNHFHIDLVFYNYILKCFLLVDLKVAPLTHGDIGQMDFYVRYFEYKIRQQDDNPTIGLILCTEKDKTIVKYSLLNESKQIFASRYKLYLPSEEELSKELEKEKHEIETEKHLQQ